MRIGFSLQKEYDRPLTQVIPLLKEAGFSAVSPLWSPELDFPALDSSVKDHGMTIQSLHAPHKNIPSLWQPDTELAAGVQKTMLCSIDDCARYEIPILVVHGWQGLDYTFPAASLDFRIFDNLVQHAQDRGVSIAFENLEGEEYLAALMARYRCQSNVGFCWDTGHDHCYPHKTDFLREYGDRLIMTHLHDNFGVRDPAVGYSKYDDLHLLPYDGNIDWDSTIAKLKCARKQAILNFELKSVSHSKKAADMRYDQLPLAEFLGEAGRRARIIADKMT